MLALALTTASAAAQDPATSTPSTVEVPTQDIVPEPNAGEAPHESGDRGGALQITVLVLVVVAVAVCVAMVVRQSRRARATP